MTEVQATTDHQVTTAVAAITEAHQEAATIVAAEARQVEDIVVADIAEVHPAVVDKQ